MSLWWWVVVSMAAIVVGMGTDPPPGIPSDWLPRYLTGDLMYAPLTERGRPLPQVGNGFVGTVVRSDSVYTGGLFNGDALGSKGRASHRARIPAFHVTVTGSTGSSRLLRQYHSLLRHDHCLCAIDQYSVCPSDSGAYSYERLEGVCSATQQPGTVPLNFFWNADADGGDNVVSTAASLPGYTLVRVACYVWQGPGGKRVPLQLFYKSNVKDHLAVATAAGIQYATSHGYTLIGTQGYVDPPPSDVQGTGQALDIQRGVFYERSIVGDVHVEDRYYAHQVRTPLLIHEILLTNRGTGNAVVHLRNTTTAASTDLNLQSLPGGPSQTRTVAGTIRTPEISQLVHVAVVNTLAPPTVQVPPGQTVTLYAFTVVATSLNSSDPVAAARAAHTDAVASSSHLYGDHTAAWAQRWETGRIGITGDLHLGQAINASIYALRSSIRSDWPYSLSPGGLGSDAYNGHTFWDMETWMFPALLMLEPNVAASGLQYRHTRMGEARNKAKGYGYQGTMYPWESAYTGTEVQGSGGKVGPWGRYEQHITGDIGFAAMQYWHATRDVNWLKAIGWPLAQGIAEFWASRVTPKGTTGDYSIIGVMPPDEYHSPVDNSAYTNAVAGLALRFAVEAAEVVGATPGANWTHIADHLPLPFDTQRQYHPEFDGYKGDRVKQGDVILLGFPLMVDMPNIVRANDLEYYAPRTDPGGPAMTWAMFAVGWLDVGNLTSAAKLFRRGYANVQDPFKVWTETPTGGTIGFITGAGGFIQSVLFGYGGLRLTRAGLVVNAPPPPSPATEVTLNSFHYLQSRLTLGVTSTHLTIQLLEGGTPPLFLTCGQQRTLLNRGHIVSVPRAPCAIHT